MYSPAPPLKTHNLSLHGSGTQAWLPTCTDAQSLIMKSPYKSLVLLPGGSLRFRVPVNFEGFLKVSFEGSFRHLLCLGLRVYPNLGNYPFCFEGVGVRI